MPEEEIQPEQKGQIRVFSRKDIEGKNRRIDMDFFDTLMKFQYGTSEEYENAANKLFGDKRGLGEADIVKKEKIKKNKKRHKVRK